MHCSGRIPVIILEDTDKRSCLAIEISQEETEAIRLFAVQSGPAISPAQADISRIESVFSDLGVKRVFFEDIGRSMITKLLRRMGYREAKIFELERRVQTSWPVLDDPPTSGNFRYFGVADDTSIETSKNNRRLLLRDQSGPIGEIFFTDYGRFARCKANLIDVEGFGRLFSDTEPSLLMKVLFKELKKERKRYLILGPEFGECSSEIHPFPLWHMVLSKPRRMDHGCRIATEPDKRIIATLASEYENTSQRSALTSITKKYSNSNFQYILSSRGEGFALIKFMEGAEGMLHDLYISPIYQGKGVGDELLRATISHLSENCIRLHLNTIYPRAKKLYEKYGFETIFTDLCVPLRQKMMISPTL